jgi:quercetin dioxygenase-like cupin family protein
MKITRRAEALRDLAPLDRSHFTGDAASRALMEAPTSAAALVVRFEPGVRNYWHSHAGGQLLHVVEGVGWVQARGAQAQRIETGDFIWTAPNEEHWHGAGRQGPMAHLTVAMGETRWLEVSPEPPG